MRELFDGRVDADCFSLDDRAISHPRRDVVFVVSHRDGASERPRLRLAAVFVEDLVANLVHELAQKHRSGVEALGDG